MKIRNFTFSVIVWCCVIKSCLCFYIDVDNSEKDLGDACFMRDKSTGTCKRPQDCQHAMKLAKEQKHGQLVRCMFEKDKSNFYVCCPDEKVSSTTAPAEKFGLKKSKKFEKALCKNKSKPAFNFDFHISNGKKADPQEFPYQAALGYRTRTLDNELTFQCGGSLIADDIVLTAAHCFNRENAVMVRLGRVSLDSHDFFH